MRASHKTREIGYSSANPLPPWICSALSAAAQATRTYHFRISATNAGGPSLGEEQTFKTLPAVSAPTVVTGTASPQGSHAAILNATVNPNGAQVTECQFEYGPTNAYGSSAACSQMVGSGTSPVAVSAWVSGLSASGSYYFRISATNADGMSKGSESTFTMAAPGNEPHYYYNGSGAGSLGEEGLKVPVVSWGTLSLTNTKGGTGGTVTCHDVVGGWVENPVSTYGETGPLGPAGIGETQTYGAYECESTGCTPAATGGGPATYVSILAEPAAFLSQTNLGGSATNLGWKSHLFYESSTKLIRDETEGIRVDVQCHVQTGATGTGEPVFGTVTSERSEGSYRPSSGKFRATAGAPPELQFDTKGAGSGELHGPPPSETTRTEKTEGNLKLLGYAGQEVVNTKNG